jgi:cytochrome c
MFDTMTATKIVGGFCGAFLVFLLFRLGAEAIYQPGHGGYAEPVEQAYTVAVEGGESAGPAAPAVEMDVDAILAAGDATKGEKLFGNCKACHKIDGNDGTGPHLNGVVGRPVASVAGFPYSDALKALGGDWTPDRLVHFLHGPQAYAPKTKMTFKGFKKEADLGDIVAFLKTQS